MLPPHLATIFGELWKARSAKRLVNKTRLMFVLYGDDPDGGPESDNIIAVKLMHLRKAIAPLGLTVRGRFGYFLADIVREEIAA